MFSKEVTKFYWSFSRWGSTMPWSRGKWVWFWFSWGTLGHKDTHTCPLVCSTWFVRVPPLGGQRIRRPLPHRTHASGRECDTWCLQHLPKNVYSRLLFEILMDVLWPLWNDIYVAYKKRRVQMHLVPFHPLYIWMCGITGITYVYVRMMQIRSDRVVYLL